MAGEALACQEDATLLLTLKAQQSEEQAIDAI